MQEQLFALTSKIAVIALTSDGWSDKRMRRFICVTGHWIDEMWKLKSRTLGFKNIPGKLCSLIVPSHTIHQTVLILLQALTMLFVSPTRSIAY